MHFRNWVFSIWVFLDGYSSIERVEDVAGQERQSFPVQTGNIFRSRPACDAAGFWLNREMQPVQIGLAEATLLDLQQFRRLQLLEVGANATIGRPHVFCERNLSGEASVIAPRVFEQHRISELGADGNIRVRQNEIRDLSEAVTRRKIGTNDFNVALSEDVANVPLGLIFHHCHYTRPATYYPLLIHGLACGRRVRG